MKNKSLSKLSLLSLILLAASAVTAAIFPKDKTANKEGALNSLTQTTTDSCSIALTCITTNAAASEPCTRTVTVLTTTSHDGSYTSTDREGNETFIGNQFLFSTDDGVYHPNTSFSPC